METERVAALGAPGGGFWGATVVCMESRRCAKPGANNPPSGVSSGLLIAVAGSQMRTICLPGDIWQCFEMLFAVLTGWGRFLLASSGQRPEMLLNPATEHGTAHSPKCPEC